jgi:hypothetical protein
MKLPSQHDYVDTYFTLFELFQQARNQRADCARPFTSQDQALIVFLSMMLLKRINAFKAQHRWWISHLQEIVHLGMAAIPQRTTLSWRFKDLYDTIQAFTCFLG